MGGKKGIVTHVEARIQLINPPALSRDWREEPPAFRQLTQALRLPPSGDSHHARRQGYYWSHLRFCGAEY